MTFRSVFLLSALIPAVPAAAQSAALESLRYGAFSGFGVSAAGAALDVPLPPGMPDAPVKVPARRLRPRPEPVFPCENLPVTYVKNGSLYVNGKQVSSRVQSHEAACTGDVAWMDSYGALYLNGDRLGSAQSFNLAKYSGDVAWIDGHGDLWKNRVELGGLNGSYYLVETTGDVIWTDGFGDLWKDRVELGRAQAHRVARWTGDVFWQDSFGNLHKNDVELGRHDVRWYSLRVSDLHGVAAWEDTMGYLHKDGRRITDRHEWYEMREDGVLVWRDGWGDVHSE